LFAAAMPSKPATPRVPAIAHRCAMAVVRSGGRACAFALWRGAPGNLAHDMIVSVWSGTNVVHAESSTSAPANNFEQLELRLDLTPTQLACLFMHSASVSATSPARTSHGYHRMWHVSAPTHARERRRLVSLLDRDPGASLARARREALDRPSQAGSRQAHGDAEAVNCLRVGRRHSRH
jgi:hypothetical protein